MANEIYSSSYWGNGVCDNDIGWGGVYKDLAGCTAAFNNTYSMALDGIDDYIGLGTITDLNGGVSAFSTSLWFNYSGTPSTSNNMLLSGGTGVTDRLYIQLIATDTIRYTMGGGFDDVNVGTLTSGTWYNLITVHDGADVDIYLNGTLKGSFTDQVPTSNFATTMKIGNYISGAYWWNGNIDEVSLFNSAKAIGDLWDGSGKPTDLTGESGLISWWRMGDEASWDGSKWTLLDQGSGGNNAESVNMTESDREEDTPS